jgi:hypothetical protein
MTRHGGMTMKRMLTLFTLLVLTLNLTACELVGGIFRVGIWAGVIMVLLILLVVWGIARMFKR